jgi:hypothetical protein
MDRLNSAAVYPVVKNFHTHTRHVQPLAERPVAEKFAADQEVADQVGVGDGRIHEVCIAAVQTVASHIDVGRVELGLGEVMWAVMVAHKDSEKIGFVMAEVMWLVMAAHIDLWRKMSALVGVM